MKNVGIKQYSANSLYVSHVDELKIKAEKSFTCMHKTQNETRLLTLHTQRPLQTMYSPEVTHAETLPLASQMYFSTHSVST